ncbi:membrane protein insertion efficiency factor YidD [Cellulomonas bogoriensis]|uniref:Membrane protein insertion efficiency factor YidD n=1 Tax=Cellulomonas bogoriensis 69B4 = DSM 16987 TaxID=1386082 RepID=A0A0A0C3X6_9CELL|nr:membrane protein insertion efficiency factor YidD [Cellulomonas bogoriensis]KGM14084.1 hypothetical protein N869_04680 [Cellulomonas bogoriensis 69B4 = DSM 16987]
MSPAASVVDAMVRWYQVHVSPRKGWRCAHSVAHGGLSCSGAVRRAVRRRGVLGGALPTTAQFLACYHAAQLLMADGANVQGVCCCGGIPIPFRF